MAVNKKLALKRVQELFEQAEIEENHADRYVELARKVAQKAQISIPAALRRRYCHKCYSYIVSGKTGTVRTYKQQLIVTCKKCANKDRYPLK